MNRFTRLDHLRHLWLALLALAVFARMLIPAGWMPVADADGVRLMLCSGWANHDEPAKAQHGHQNVGQQAHAQRGGGAKHEPTKKSDHSAPCTFAASALAVPLPSEAAVLATAAATAVFYPAAVFVQVGQGLAAPPPPSTGPPHSF